MALPQTPSPKNTMFYLANIKKIYLDEWLIIIKPPVFPEIIYRFKSFFFFQRGEARCGGVGDLNSIWSQDFS